MPPRFWQLTPLPTNWLLVLMAVAEPTQNSLPAILPPEMFPVPTLTWEPMKLPPLSMTLWAGTLKLPPVIPALAVIVPVLETELPEMLPPLTLPLRVPLKVVAVTVYPGAFILPQLILPVPTFSEPPEIAPPPVMLRLVPVIAPVERLAGENAPQESVPLTTVLPTTSTEKFMVPF